MDIAQSGAHRYIVLSEKGPVALLAALMAAIESIRTSDQAQADVLSSLEPGEDIILSVFDPAGFVPSSMASRTRWAASESAPKMASCSFERNFPQPSGRPKPHNTLSGGGEISAWQKNYTPTPLRHLVGFKVNLDSVRPRVLLVSRKTDLDQASQLIRPLGYTVPQLIGTRFFTSAGRIHDLPGSDLAEPLLWCCGDALVARDILEEEGFAFKYVLVDDDGRLARPSLKSSRMSAAHPTPWS